uniref:Cytochrome c oxidase subunit 2 n=1 Tax=Capsaspora owczarzaki TaxID=192875 RepID=M1K4N2_9EUKA|nr:cytochrome c oxidase subunit 2 [Capsaspora owczarzaki]
MSISLLIGLTLQDQATTWQFGFQDSASFLHEEVVYLHNHIMQYASLIIGLSGVLLVTALTRSNGGISHRFMVHGTTLEIIWTIAPAIILILIGVPSFKLLYLQDEIVDAALTIKAIGRQWYWSYEYSDYAENADSITFDSYMTPTADLNEGELRLLEVDNRLTLPIDTNTRFVTTASDVIHSFTVPSLGMKVDAVPGRLNTTSTQIDRPGTFYGQCSEICGYGHGFMPIVIDAVNVQDYTTKIVSQLQELE